VSDLQIVIAALFVSAAGLNALANWLNVPYPIPLVVGGLVLGLVPGIPDCLPLDDAGELVGERSIEGLSSDAKAGAAGLPRAVGPDHSARSRMPAVIALASKCSSASRRARRQWRS
jgi:hypothetical protein